MQTILQCKRIVNRIVCGALICGYAALCGAAPTPNISGVWEPVAAPTAIRTVDGKLPPLLPAAKTLYDRHIAARAAKDTRFDTTEKCLPPGVPRLLYMGQVEVVQQPQQTTLLYQWNRLIRTVLMDVPQPQVPGPTYNGQSVGRWQGDSFVIDTIGFGYDTTLDAAGLPHSDALHVMETYTPNADVSQMTVRITIEDPKTYSKPWNTQLTLQRKPGAEISEDVCLERKHISWGELRQTGVDTPPEKN